jgi:hypothetical protein
MSVARMLCTLPTIRRVLGNARRKRSMYAPFAGPSKNTTSHNGGIPPRQPRFLLLVTERCCRVHSLRWRRYGIRKLRPVRSWTAVY